MRELARALALGSALVAFATPTLADVHGEAEQLFREGLDLRKAGRVAEACKSFEASQRLDPDLATLMNLADCREKNQQLATAWSLFLQVGRKARGDETYAGMGDIALQRAAALEPRLSHLVINVPDESRIEGLVIERNGEAVDAATWNRPIAVDGGRYVIVARAPDHEPWTSEVAVTAERDEKSVDVPRFEEAETAGLAGASTRARAEARDGARGRRTLALGVGAGALASFGLAVGFELSGRSTYAEYERMPGDPTLYERANRNHHVAQACVGLGVAATGVALYLWVTGSRTSDRPVAVVPIAAPGTGGLAFARRF